MNILVIGGGTKGRFGNRFVEHARSQGHRVLVVSHKDHGYDNTDHVVADFNSTDDVVNKVEFLLSKIDVLDIFLFNTVAGKGPWNEWDFKSDSTFFDESEWLWNLRLNVIIPNNLSIICLKKMIEGSKLIYMTTGRSYAMEVTHGPFIPSYYGAKAWLNHVMIAFAHYNDKKVISTGITGHIDYGDSVNYDRAFEKAYNHIMNINESHNGKIISAAIA